MEGNMIPPLCSVLLYAVDAASAILLIGIEGGASGASVDMDEVKLCPRPTLRADYAAEPRFSLATLVSLAHVKSPHHAYADQCMLQKCTA